MRSINYVGLAFLAVTLAQDASAVNGEAPSFNAEKVAMSFAWENCPATHPVLVKIRYKIDGAQPENVVLVQSNALGEIEIWKVGSENSLLTVDESKNHLNFAFCSATSWEGKGIARFIEIKTGRSSQPITFDIKVPKEVKASD